MTGLYDVVRRSALQTGERAVARGMPPAWFGWRWVREETLDAHLARSGTTEIEVIHRETRAINPLPRNVADVDELPADPDWFGFSFRDVPQRVSGRTARVTLPDATVVTFRDDEQDRFWPAVLTNDARSLALREVRFRRPGHTRALRDAGPPVRVPTATWFLERVYENHSHWLTAHLPKLCLLARRDALGDVILPARRTPVIDASLAMLGIDAADLRTHDPSRPLLAGRLTLLETDRFRPELLRPVRDVLARFPGRPPWRRVFVSRAQARIRTLVNEAELVPVLDRHGFEIVRMEALDFAAQIELMGQTSVLLAPHGAGLTNMMFCQPGAHVIEIADFAYPNPNFYALAAAMDLNYWIARGELVAQPGRRPLDRDLKVDPARVAAILRELDG